MCNYHPKFCYGTHTTHGQKVYFLYPFLKYFPLILRFRLIRVFLVLEYSVNSAFQNIQYFPCFRVFRVFRILENSVCSAIPIRRSTIIAFLRIDSPQQNAENQRSDALKSSALLGFCSFNNCFTRSPSLNDPYAWFWIPHVVSFLWKGKEPGDHECLANCGAFVSWFSLLLESTCVLFSSQFGDFVPCDLLFFHFWKTSWQCLRWTLDYKLS